MKTKEEDLWAFAVVVFAIVVVAVSGLVCMTIERTIESTEAIKAGLVQDSNGRWVKP